VFPFDKQDEVSPPSLAAIGGVFTNNGSRALAFGGRLYLKEDKYRIAGGVGGLDVNLDIYGVGLAAGNRGTFVPLNVSGGGAIGEFLYAVRKGVYIGARGQYRRLQLGLNRERLESSDITVQPPDQVAGVVDQIRSELLGQRTVSIGPRFTWDIRDNTFYPKTGVLIEGAMDAFGQALGSKWTYQYYKFAANKYVKVRENQIIALRAMACAAAGSRVPIYDLCLYGTTSDLRGYPGGRFQDRRMFATQTEYRYTLPAKGILGRVGFVAFGGFGAVGPSFSDMPVADWLPAGGGGVRFRLTKRHPINFRLDYGVGRVGHTVSMGVLEAF
jgi:hypothetical protein